MTCNRFAGKRIEIRSLYPAVHWKCRSYRTDGAPDLIVEITPADIDNERERARQRERAGNAKKLSYTDAYLETLVVYRQIAERMPLYDTVLMHASAIAVEGHAYLFTAKSGTGKSTHARLWREMLKDKAVMINDDKPFLLMDGDRFIVYGTPWAGKHNLDNDIAVPLKAVCLLEQAKENSIRAADSEEALFMLMQQVYRPADKESLEKTMDLIDGMLHVVKFYHLSCNMDSSAAELSYRVMREGLTEE